jgi:hypothetical protein
MTVKVASLFSSIGSQKLYEGTFKVRPNGLMRFLHESPELDKVDVVFVRRGQNKEEYNVLQCVGSTKAKFIEPHKGKYGYEIQLTEDQLNCVVPLRQTLWTFWQQWFVKYKLQWYFDKDDKLSRIRLQVIYGLFNRRAEFEELLYFNDVTALRSLKGRILGYGDIIIRGHDNSTKTLYINNIVDARDVASRLNDVIHDLKSENVGRHEWIPT